METVQVSATIPKELQYAVKEEAVRDSRTFSKMVEHLLSSAIKERERQRNKNAGRKKGNTANIPADSR